MGGEEFETILPESRRDFPAVAGWDAAALS
jgi:hypothetical protein